LSTLSTYVERVDYSDVDLIKVTLLFKDRGLVLSLLHLHIIYAKGMPVFGHKSVGF
jgi:hypothetical protein